MANEITVTGTSFDVMTPQVAQYVERYHTFLTKTVESILELGKVVFEADKELVGADKQAFCQAIKLNDQDSTYKKLKQIGSAYNELMKYKDRLPSNWTTIYQLALVVGARLDSLVEKNVLSPNVTMGEIKLYLSQLSGKAGSNETSVSFSIRLNETNKIKMFQLEQELKNVAERLGLKFDVPKSSTYKAWHTELIEFKKAA